MEAKSTYPELIQNMSTFLLEEPSGRFFVEGWHKSLRSFELDKLSKFYSRFDETGEITLLYLARFCKALIENTGCYVMEALINSPQLEKYRKCLGWINSKEVLENRKALIEKMALVVSALSGHKLIGDLESLGKDVDGAVDAVFETFPKLKYEIYSNSGVPIGNLSTTSLSVQACGSLAECLLRLEKSPDGIYVCYISNPGTLDGWFGFFVHSNGNLFSYNERIDEAYIGQHGYLRNGRYAEDKAYDLFPYELCEPSEETDYKGYSKEIKIGERLKLIGEKGDDFGILIRMLLSMSVIAQNHGGKTIDGEPVIVNSLLPSSLALLAESKESTKTTAVVEWKSSPIVEYTAKSAIPSFEVEKVLNGEYNKEFNEVGYFEGRRQDIIDAYGEGFSIEQDKILASNSSLRLLGDGSVEQEFIGSKDRMRAQAYYEVREQLCNYIGKRMEDEFQAFGGKEGMRKWYREHLEAKREKILRYCLEAYKTATTGENGRTYGRIYINSDKDKPGMDSLYKDYDAVRVRVDDKVDMGFWGYLMLCQHKDNKRTCWVNGSKVSYYFRFDFFSYRQVQDFLGCCLPKFCIGWESDHFPCGNSILNMVDPIDQMIHPLMHRSAPFSFNFAVALSKSAINKIGKNA